ncbi:hypothetical protein ODJ79_01825 [Actinoplanes sp. KI2]|uniref:hypothetical protein n=1 Tax=Actinoplanes sp. KI2 TaxID=2983315 RepID=UPI0021D58727|nr:hypothetical protein [Actinoplanes sp. KI2]MCU7722444.1 hypothetical protein [Actinoplanes sp. KI2]
MRRITMLRSAAIGSAVAAVLAMTAGPARADAVPQLTAFSVSTAAVDVTNAAAQITVTMTVSDPDATGVGSGSVTAYSPLPVPTHPSGGQLVQVGGTATNTRYRADITLPAGTALDYQMIITFRPAGEAAVDLQSQLVASGWANHTITSVTAVPDAPVNFTFRRDIGRGGRIIKVNWAEPEPGRPIATGATVTSSGCGIAESITYNSVWFIGPPADTTTCTVTVRVTNSAGASPPTTASATL